jgi:hypothetical protein
VKYTHNRSGSSAAPTREVHEDMTSIRSDVLTRQFRNTTFDSLVALARAVQDRGLGSSGTLTREVQAGVTLGNLGALTRQFRKLDHSTRLQEV